MLIDALLTVGGLVLLVFGADFLVRGAVALAQRLGISPMVIGLTIVAFGTSLPELVVSLEAALGGSTPLAVGNVVGSNIANILLILGAAALIQPISCNRAAVVRDGLAMLVATVGFIAAGLAVTLGVVYGVVALICLFGYLYWSYLSDRRATAAGKEAEEDGCAADSDVEPLKGPIYLALLATAGGLVGVIVGADMLVNGATGLARSFGVSEEVIGLTLVAFGTSVPELATTIVAAFRRHADVALGNVLGSNMFNLLGIMGVVTLLVPVDLPPKIAAFDIWVMLAVSIILFPFLRSGWRLSRVEGTVFLALYAAFIVAAFLGVGDALMETMGAMVGR